MKLFQNKLFLPILLASLYFWPQTSLSQHFNSRVEGTITTAEQGDLLKVTGSAKNKTQEIYSLRYEFSVITSEGKNNNTSKNQQNGRLTLDAFETKVLAESVIAVDPEANTILLLVIFDQDDKVMGTDRLVLEPSAKTDHNFNYQKPNEGIVLTGMVTDRTKTKPGKDFYGYFFQKYNLSPVQRNEIIEIDEIISFGRTTRLSVKVNNEVVFQFFAKPNLEYLQNMADEALRRLNRYFEYLDNKSEITQ